jgi:hypothetical protein
MEPTEKKLDEALKEAYGDSGPQVLDQLRRSCHRIVSELSLFRADLSYMPKYLALASYARTVRVS